MNCKLKFVVFSVLLGLHLVWTTQSVAQEEEWSLYPKQILICLEAKDQMGDEWRHAELMGAREAGKAGCEIIIMFANKKDIEKFDKLRKKKGLDPNFVDYKDRKIKIAKTIGKIGRIKNGF